ncbi:hypothetical protein B0T10DRAFT_608262 [Thelonectria olida]|uniref:Protein kinase domain-containing protein n=1 Tax=Thelonectria olida TaxID=1576542 RepID=A0A9P8W0L3_9HYPO|nr:hypothetical protein B0T10DRAFT_608262 [Thelonectria olida]
MERRSSTSVVMFRRSTPENELNDIRNVQTIQSAIIRGDSRVYVNNAKFVHPDVMSKFRYTNREGKRIGMHNEPRFREIELVDQPDKFSDDEVRNLFYHTEWKGFRLEFIKILGAGGFGAATLWNVDFEGGISRKVVIKIPTTEEFDPANETAWHNRYAGSQHTVQIVNLDQLAQQATDEFRTNHPRKTLKYNRGIEFNPLRQKAMVLEYMCHGDLFGILKKASEQNVQFPDRALWGIWECIVNGLAAVAYQPAFTGRGQVFEDEVNAARQAGLLDDFLRRLESMPVSHDVHFDLEETNILVGESPDQPGLPIFKLHDFSEFSFFMRRAWQTWETKSYWKRRHPVKMTRISPEQIHEDWDKISTNADGAVGEFQGENLSRGHPIAGRYGMWTNIFLAAKTMEAAITLIYLAHPMTAKRYTSINGTTTGKTYGWRLNRSSLANVDADLRDNICQCLFERPVDRPNVVSLLRKVEERKQMPFKQSEKELKKFWKELLAPKPAQRMHQTTREDKWERVERNFKKLLHIRRGRKARNDRKEDNQAKKPVQAEESARPRNAMEIPEAARTHRPQGPTRHHDAVRHRRAARPPSKFMAIRIVQQEDSESHNEQDNSPEFEYQPPSMNFWRGQAEQSTAQAGPSGSFRPFPSADALSFSADTSFDDDDEDAWMEEATFQGVSVWGSQRPLPESRHREPRPLRESTQPVHDAPIPRDLPESPYRSPHQHHDFHANPQPHSELPTYRKQQQLGQQMPLTRPLPENGYTQVLSQQQQSEQPTSRHVPQIPNQGDRDQFRLPPLQGLGQSLYQDGELEQCALEAPTGLNRSQGHSRTSSQRRHPSNDLSGPFHPRMMRLTVTTGATATDYETEPSTDSTHSNSATEPEIDENSPKRRRINYPTTSNLRPSGLRPRSWQPSARSNKVTKNGRKQDSKAARRRSQVISSGIQREAQRTEQEMPVAFGNLALREQQLERRFQAKYYDEDSE